MVCRSAVERGVRQHAAVAQLGLVLLQEGQHRLHVGPHRVAAAHRLEERQGEGRGETEFKSSSILE